MLGWEFPPFISGGLGTACYGLTKAMNELNIQVTFVLPKIVTGQYGTHVKLLSPASLSEKSFVSAFKTDELENVKFCGINSALQPYSRPESYGQEIKEVLQQKQNLHSKTSDSTTPFTPVMPFVDVTDFANMDYSGDMYTEIYRYAAIAAELAKTENFDVIHAHDWMTYPAAMATSKVSGKPLIVQVHSTEFDRSGDNVNQTIYDIEREGMYAADKIIAVSYFTRNTIISRYGVSGDKIEVVHNGIERNGSTKQALAESGIGRDEKIVLFLGRITMQKGPEYFLQAAKKVLEVRDDVKFVMAGSGDMMYRMVEMASELGIGKKVLFTGFLRGENVQKIYRMADLFVMPSVSEPFGLVPLEAMENDVPVIISKQSGVSEVLTHVLKVDFWDIDEMANKIVAVLKHSPLRITLRNHGNHEVRKLRWTDSAAKCAKIYEQAVLSV